MERVERVISDVGKSEFEVKTLPSPSTQQPIAKVQILTMAKARELAPVPFAGNADNIGNTGGIDPLGLVGLPGGKGLPGESGFSVVVLGKE